MLVTQNLKDVFANNMFVYILPILDTLHNFCVVAKLLSEVASNYFEPHFLYAHFHILVEYYDKWLGVVHGYLELIFSSCKTDKVSCFECNEKDSFSL